MVDGRLGGEMEKADAPQRLLAAGSRRGSGGYGGTLSGFPVAGGSACSRSIGRVAPTTDCHKPPIHSTLNRIAITWIFLDLKVS